MSLQQAVLCAVLAINNDRASAVTMQTEDFALALELQVAGCMGCYVPQVLAVGEVPVTLRGCFMQRSRCVAARSPQSLTSTGCSVHGPAALLRHAKAAGSNPCTACTNCLVIAGVCHGCRWCKGGMQIWFSRFNPLLRRGLSIGMRLLWCTNFWGYFFNIAATVGQLIVPLIGVFGPVFPIKNSLWWVPSFSMCQGQVLPHTRGC